MVPEIAYYTDAPGRSSWQVKNYLDTAGMTGNIWAQSNRGVKQGRISLSTMSRSVAILLSRQPLRPCRETPWVAKTAEAVAWVTGQGLTLSSSVGMQTWELITALGSIAQVPMRLYWPCPAKEFVQNHDEVCHQFDLCAHRVEFVPVGMERAGKEGGLMARDKAIIEQADILIPIAVRPGGNMHKLLERARSRVEIVNDFLAPVSNSVPNLAYRIGQCAMNPEIDDAAHQYLVHWTRTAHTAWPGERLIDFYRDIVSSSVYPRGAFATLRQILQTRQIKASSRHMPGNTPAVALTGLSPREVIPLMRWRARYTEMSFEPYGIGIRQTLADKIGLRPVHYYVGKRELSERAEPWLWQSIGTKTDWRQEQEYRHLGDLDLSHIDSTDLVGFTRFPGEATAITQEFNIRAVSLTLA